MTHIATDADMDEWASTVPVSPEGDELVPRAELDAMRLRAEKAEAQWYAEAERARRAEHALEAYITTLTSAMKR